ncbi:hypothetical protein BDY19DRAFT_858495, partial [Irpex rosettiformis]
DVWAPAILSPKSGDVWASGQTQNVTWDLSSQPAQITNNNGFILLRSSGAGTPVVLAHDFLLTDGSVEITVPDVLTRDDYGITLFGDSGDIVDGITINGVV